MQAEVYRDHNRRLVGILIQCQTESPNTRVFGDHRQQAHAFRTGEDLGSAAVDPHAVTVAGSVLERQGLWTLDDHQFMDGVIWRSIEDRQRPVKFTRCRHGPLALCDRLKSADNGTCRSLADWRQRDDDGITKL